MTKVIHRAGMIIYHTAQNGKDVEMLFMRPSEIKFGGNCFQIPKGKIDAGESPEEAALREANEEVGLFKGNIEGDMHRLGVFLGRTTFYVAKVKDKGMFGDPLSETKETKWMTPEQFDEDGRVIHKPVVNAAVRYIYKKEGIKNEQ